MATGADTAVPGPVGADAVGASVRSVQRLLAAGVVPDSDRAPVLREGAIQTRFLSYPVTFTASPR
jgi:hypothetical protein